MNEETAALLRVMVYTQNNTAFGGQVPTVPQPWTGPPPSIVQVQTILLASLFTSLLSAFLAMLGKQWLNRCMPVDARGTIIERSQYRQRKFDGIVNWYFNNVMEALPLMLQAALLLLGCALSRYLWEINTTVASVVLGITAFGVLFYLFIVIAGVVSENCPYQTPVANFLRYTSVAISHTPFLLHRGARSIRYMLHCIAYTFRYIRGIFQWVQDILHGLPEITGHIGSGSSISGIICGITCGITCGIVCGTFVILCVIIALPIVLIKDLCKALTRLSIRFIDWVLRPRVDPLAVQIAEQQTVAHVSDLRCILWTLQTSVNGPVRQAAREYLATITMDDSNPARVVASWFDIFLNCVQVTDGSAAIIQDYELLAKQSSLYCLHMLSHLVVTNPIPKVFEDVQQRYTRIFPSKINFDGLPASHALGIIHSVFYSNRRNEFLTFSPMRPLAPRAARSRVQWDNYQPSGDEHAIVARALVKFAQFGPRECAKVPRWLLRFALRSLSQDPLPPPSVAYNSLLIIAIDLEFAPHALTVDPLNQR